MKKQNYSSQDAKINILAKIINQYDIETKAILGKQSRKLRKIENVLRNEKSYSKHYAIDSKDQFNVAPPKQIPQWLIEIRNNLNFLDTDIEQTILDYDDQITRFNCLTNIKNVLNRSILKKCEINPNYRKSLTTLIITIMNLLDENYSEKSFSKEDFLVVTYVIEILKEEIISNEIYNNCFDKLLIIKLKY